MILHRLDVQYFVHKRFLDLFNLRMPDFELKAYPVIDWKLAQENDGELVLTFFIFSFKCEIGPVEIEMGMFHRAAGHLKYIRLNILKPELQRRQLLFGGFHARRIVS
jgi:hypothetical protein